MLKFVKSSLYSLTCWVSHMLGDSINLLGVLVSSLLDPFQKNQKPEN